MASSPEISSADGLLTNRRWRRLVSSPPGSLVMVGVASITQIGNVTVYRGKSTGEDERRRAIAVLPHPT